VGAELSEYSPFTFEVVCQGNWVTVRGDPFPSLRRGLQEAWKLGYLTASATPFKNR